MDKNEYNLKLAEIKRYIDQGSYAEAARIADQIDWKKVRNVNTLCMISEVYEAENRYEDSKAILLKAYRRSSVGRTVLYRLVEVTIKLKQFDEAIEYFTAYKQAAPHDLNSYILKYKIYRGRGSSLNEQIAVLKEYLDQEYTEKWAYELARLYQQADRMEECIAVCDDLVLWFHSGKYVIKALELKKKYVQLTPKQQEIYDHRFDPVEDEEPPRKEEAPIGLEKSIVETKDATLADTILEDAERSIAQDVAQAAAEEAARPEELAFLRDEAQAASDSDLSGTRIFGEMPAAKPEAEPTRRLEELGPILQAAAEGAVEETAGETAAAVKDVLSGAAEAASDTAKAAEDALSGAAEAAEDALSGAAEAAGEAASDTAEAAEDALSDAAAMSEDTLSGAAEAAGDIVSDTAEAAEEAVRDTAAAAETAVNSAAEAAERGDRTVLAADASEDGEPEEEPEVMTDAQRAALEMQERIARQGMAATIGAVEARAGAEAAQAVAAIEAREYSSEGTEGSTSARADTRTTEERQSDFLRDMRQVVGTIGRMEYTDAAEEAADEVIEASKKDQEVSHAMHFPSLHMPSMQRKQAAGQLTIDDVLMSMGERGEAVREAARGRSIGDTGSMSGNGSAAVSGSAPRAGVLSAVDEALLNMGMAPAAPAAQPGPEEAEQSAAPAQTGEPAAARTGSLMSEIYPPMPPVQEGTSAPESLFGGMDEDGEMEERVFQRSDPGEDAYSSPDGAPDLDHPGVMVGGDDTDMRRWIPGPGDDRSMEDIRYAKTKVLPTEEIARMYAQSLQDETELQPEETSAEATSATPSKTPDEATSVTPSETPAETPSETSADASKTSALAGSGDVLSDAGDEISDEELARRILAQLEDEPEPVLESIAQDVTAVQSAAAETAEGAAKSAETAAAALQSTAAETAAAAAEEMVKTAETAAGEAQSTAAEAAKAVKSAAAQAAETAESAAEALQSAAAETAAGAAKAAETALETAQDTAAQAAEMAAGTVQAVETAAEAMQSTAAKAAETAAGTVKAAETAAEAMQSTAAKAAETAAGAVQPAGAGTPAASGVPEQKQEAAAPAQEPRRKTILNERIRDEFAGFVEVRGLEKQIDTTIRQTLSKGDDRTSRTGNILIFGGHGSGKTTLAQALARVIAKERGSETLKIAQIYATDLNRKDIAATIAKIAGGFLIVEEAGDLDDNICDQLTTAMEFRTDGLVIILEDEQKYIHDLLKRHPRLTMKFTSEIFIPTYTPEELVGFADIYADEQDHALSDGAAQRLAQRIDTIQKSGEEVSILTVIDMTNQAIAKASTFGRKVFGGKKRFDEDGRIILREKDFA